MNLDYIDFEKLNNSINIIDNVLIKKSKDILNKEDFSNEVDFIFSDIILGLMNGSDIMTEKHINVILKNIPKEIQKVVKNRLYGLKKSLNNNYLEAINYFEKALKIGEKTNIKKWILRDIYIDIRNLLIIQKNINNKKFNNDKFKKIQQNIEKLSINNYYPILDKELFRAFDKFNDEMFKLNTDSPYTSRFSNNLSDSIININKALIIAIIHGSYTFIHVIRENLADLLYHYANLYDSSELHHKSLKFYILENRITKAEKILNSDWDILYDEIIDNPLNLIELPVKYEDSLQKRVFKCLFIEKLGQYIPNNALNNIQTFLIDCLDMPLNFDKKYDVKRTCLRAIKSIINRIDTNLIIKKVFDILGDNNLINDEIIKLLIDVNWNDVNKDLAKNIKDKLYDLKNNFSRVYDIYVVFYRIKIDYPSIMDEIEEKLLDEWQDENSLDISWYFGQSQYSFDFDNYMFVNDLLERIEKENKNSGLAYGGYSLFHLIANHIINNELNDCLDKTFNIFKKVLLNSEQSMNNKMECIESVMRIYNSGIQDSNILAVNVNNQIQEKKQQVFECKVDRFFNNDYYERLELKIMNLFVNVDSPEKTEAIIAKCIEYGNHSFIDVRLDSLYVIKAIVDNNISSHENEIRQYLYLKTYDKWYKIRGISLDLLHGISNNDKEWNEICIKRMKELLKDKHSYVRSSVISTIKRNHDLITETEEYYSMLKIGTRDVHFKIREQSINYLNELLV